jgi:polyisoprenoid-binding protein YceI
MMETAATQRGLEPVKYTIDPSGSRFTVQAFATGLLSAFGHNPTIGIRDYDGEIQFVPGTYEKAFVRVTVRTNAMEVTDEMKGDDRKKLEQVMYEQLLESERYPTATFESKQVTVQNRGGDLLSAQVVGDLTFHGVTQSLPLDGRITNMGSMMRISGDFTLRQSDYGIKPVSFAGGALKLKDELKFHFELVARKQE